MCICMHVFVVEKSLAVVLFPPYLLLLSVTEDSQALPLMHTWKLVHSRLLFDRVPLDLVVV